LGGKRGLQTSRGSRVYVIESQKVAVNERESFGMEDSGKKIQIKGKTRVQVKKSLRDILKGKSAQRSRQNPLH